MSCSSNDSGFVSSTTTTTPPTSPTSLHRRRSSTFQTPPPINNLSFQYYITHLSTSTHAIYTPFDWVAYNLIDKYFDSPTEPDSSIEVAETSGPRADSVRTVSTGNDGYESESSELTLPFIYDDEWNYYPESSGSRELVVKSDEAGGKKEKKKEKRKSIWQRKVGGLKKRFGLELGRWRWDFRP